MISKLILSSDIKKREGYASDVLTKLNLSQNSPDLLWFDGDSKFGVKDARKIIEFLSNKPFQGKHQAVVIISAENLTVEAQNALLKILEEHSENTTILLFALSEDQLLPTIVSRCEIKYLEKEEQNSQEYYEDIKKLINSPYENRFKYLEKLEDKEGFLKSLIHYFHTHKDKNSLSFLKDLMEAEKFSKHNVNIRAILEYLMLKMPV